MFEGGSTLTADAAALDVLAADARAENRAACRKILAAGEIWNTWAARDAYLGNGNGYDCGNNALAEIAIRLNCSKTMADNYATLGDDLTHRLHLTRAAFATGDLDYARTRRISHDTI